MVNRSGTSGPSSHSDPAAEQARLDRVWGQLKEVMDPELPFLGVVEMGMIPRVYLDSQQVVVEVMPTYLGCPATDVIRQEVQARLRNVEPDGEVRLVLTPPWTTDFITETAREKMRANGIAPPEGQQANRSFLLGKDRVIPCPRCRSSHTQLVSAFGSTACKAHYRCLDCLEPFDHFKCI